METEHGVTLQGYICSHLFTHLSASGYLGCFHLLANVNNAAVNVGEQISVQVLLSTVCRSGIDRQYGTD